MSYINHSRRTGTLEQVIGRHEDGSLLQGEADMYKRIFDDCKVSTLHWHVWYDLSLPIQYAGKSEIQIDFLLICEKGAIVLEVKGGKIEVINGRYYYSNVNGISKQMPITPFEQAHNYKWALLQHHVLNGDQLLVEYAVAFPHQEMSITSENKYIDQSFWLWDKQMHSDGKCSFADFCESILDEARDNSSRSKYIPMLTEKELDKIVKILSPTFLDKSRYAQSTLSEVLNWLHIQNLDVLEGLSKNKRLFIEGGPGTGKTTMAKAFIKKNKGLKGLYLCQNIFLHAKVKEELIQEDLYNCEVYTFGRFLNSICIGIENDYKYNHSKLKDLFSSSEYKLYDYIIIDEAQDIADQGIDIIIDNLTSISGNGMSSGNYLIFYDIEQGYNSNSRHIEDFVSRYLSFSAHYRLNENKRVITNKQIVSAANHILTLKTNSEYKKYLHELSNDMTQYLHMVFVANKKELSRSFKSAVKQSEDITNTVVLVHSVFKHIKYESDTIYDLLSDKVGIHNLDENDIITPNRSSIPFTSILKYKGLETHKVILIIPELCNIGEIENFLFEVYIGMTRAMMELQIIIYTGI